MRTLYEYMIIVECCTKLRERWTLLHPTSIQIKIYYEAMSSLRMFAARTICGGHYFDFYRNTTSFMWDSVDDMTSTHELPTRYRPLFGMFGRSTCEKVTDPSMLLLLALGWYHTAHRLFGGSYLDKSMRDQHQNQVKWGLHTNFKWNENGMTKSGIRSP